VISIIAGGSSIFSRLTRIVVLFSIVILISTSLHSTIVEATDEDAVQYEIPTFENPTSASHLSELVRHLMNVTTDTRDSDNDTLPDSIESIIGTDPMNNDTDFDRLNDSYEVWNDLNPTNPDTNGDDLPDFLEINNVPADIDSDGKLNAFDFDNDGDGVYDAIDISPFSRTNVQSNFTIQINTSGNPTYVNFQVVPEDPEHLKLAIQSWDWPYDDVEPMRQLDDSKQDLRLTPLLELKIPAYYSLVSKYTDGCIGIENASLSNGAIARLSPIDEQDNELWIIEQSSNGYFKLKAKHSGQYLEVKGSSLDEDALAVQNPTTSLSNQLWKIEAAEDGYYKIISKNSDKCLEIGNLSQGLGSVIWQGAFNGEDSQLWKLSTLGNVIPQQPELSALGIIAGINKLFVPLYPVSENGKIVALGGKMYYPQSSPLNISLETRLLWFANGNTDEIPVKAMKGSNGLYLTVDPQGLLKANSTEVGDSQKLEWDNLAWNRWDIWPIGMLSMKAANGKYLSVGSDGSITATADKIGDSEKFITYYLKPLGIDKWVLRGYNNKYVTLQPDGTISSNGNSVGDAQKFEFKHLYYKENFITLAKYGESFSISGLIVEENYGTKVGLLYGQDIDNTMLVNMIMSYVFLRNSTTTLEEMPEILSEHNVSFDSDIRSFSHNHEAMLALTTEMIGEAIDNLPTGSILPIINAIEDSSASRSMDDIASGCVVSGNLLSFDVTSEPVIVTKSLKLPWVDTSSGESADTDDILSELRSWGAAKSLNPEDLETMIQLSIAWEAGESRVIRIGMSDFSFSAPEMPAVLTAISDYGINSFDILSRVIIGIYAVYKFVKASSVEKMGGAAWKVLRSVFQKVSISKVGIIGKLNRIGSALNIIGWIITGILAFYAFMAIAIELGGNFGLYVGGLYATMMIAYAVILFAITVLIPYVGWLIALAIAISDLMCELFGKGSWSQAIMEWIVDLFTDYRTRSEVELSIEDTSVEIDDFDNNGLTAGDKIIYSSRILGNVTLTEYGSTQDLTESYIRPTYTITAPLSSSSQTGNYRNLISVKTDDQSYKATLYDTGAWIIPGIGMINFPLIVGLSADYKTYYDEGYWVFGWEYDRESSSGTTQTDPSTMYMDVMPKNLTDFIGWKEISCNDFDGDGIDDDDESYISDKWKWDSDGDGLNDKYERDIGTNEHNFDSDYDGLNDRTEVRLRTDSYNSDTDGDNISDYLETIGWLIQFNYSNESFVWRVDSDPFSKDTDGDGIEDQMEYWSNLNPRSNDTNGDGINDVANPRTFPTLEMVAQWGSEGTGEGQFKGPYGIAVDSNGYVYVTDTGNHRVQKFDSDGNFILEWGSAGTGNGQFKYPVSVAVGPQGFVYVCEAENCRIQIFTSDGVYLGKWGSMSGSNPNPYAPPGTFLTPYGMTVDSQGYVYVADLGNLRIQKFNAYGGFITYWLLRGAGSYPEGPYCYNLAVKNGLVYVVEYHPSMAIQVFTTNGVFVKYIKASSPQIPFSPIGVDADDAGNLFVTDWQADCVWKVDQNGMPIYIYGVHYGEEQFDNPWKPTLSSDGYLYVSDASNDRILKFRETLAVEPPLIDDNVTDRDEDGLDDDVETQGWDIPVKNSTGTFNIHVTSEILLVDTDFDGLTDFEEYQIGSNPRRADTDDDGLSDLEERPIGTFSNDCDTDGDGLDDYIETQFKSDPLRNDTDGEGLLDAIEFNIGTNPNKNDTDGDGLTDYYEYIMGYDPLHADSDGDFLFDKEESERGTEPQNPDNDGDGLKDGLEIMIGTDPFNYDTDGDMLSDGEEYNIGTNPLSVDTDGDGLTDYEEVMRGTDPLKADTDRDGIPDSDETNISLPSGAEVIVVADIDPTAGKFAEDLGSLANVTLVSPEELLLNHLDARYIVLVGRPGAGNSTVGNLMFDLLKDMPDVLAYMQTSDDYRIAVRYGVWESKQTVVLLSNPYPSDHFRILNILEELDVTIFSNAAILNYAAPSNFFSTDIIDVVRATDSEIAFGIEEQRSLILSIEKFNATTTPNELNKSAGLGKYELAVGRYVAIDIFNETSSIKPNMTNGAMLKIYYTLSDIDRTGDGDTDDFDDLNETTLSIYYLNESLGIWTKLDEGLSWVVKTGVNTEDVSVYGKEYAGYVYAYISHLSFFGLAGLPNNRPPDISDAHPSIEYLWAPNHKFVDVFIEGVVDPDGDPIYITILNITSDEPTLSPESGGKKHSPDAYGIGTSIASLRAERDENSNGRVYVIHFLASDGRGGEAVGSVTVCVPHDKRGGGYSCIDDGQYYDATVIN